jgi:gamma-glutamylcyclotransferase (GGCT)/AIG2-like uncharacterized protein YtfP
MTEYLFVYGTLRPSRASDEGSRLLKQLRRVGHARVSGRLYDLGEFPGAVLDKSAGTLIRGELFALPNDGSILNALDKYEEFDGDNGKQSLFVRTKASVEVFDGRHIESWIYVYNRDPGNAPIITSGDYSESRAA